MFKIEYTTWKNICCAYRSLSEGSKKVSLQWFPFTKLSKDDWEYLISQEFYDSYIKSGSFLLFESAIQRSENHIQKRDGSFRDASLVSPVLYLVLQSVGCEISRVYKSQRKDDISVYYAGSYDTKLTVKYKKEYDTFFKEINSYQDTYKYYIKTDIANFFTNINLDKLIERIDYVCNKDSVNFSQTRLQLYKKLLEYSGEGRFPLIENSIMSSFLATEVYLDQVDCELQEFIEKKVESITDFKMIRYVDDLYILISSEESEKDVKTAYNKIRIEYSSILKKCGLAINSHKCKMGLTIDINSELKKSLYDEIIYGNKHNIEELYPGSLEGFLEKILGIVENECLNIERYNELIDSYFSFEDIEFTPTEVFNYLVYESEVDSEKVTNLMNKIIKKDFSVLSFDPKRLGVLVMKTHDVNSIKTILNVLFQKHKIAKWNLYDISIAITYLVQRGFCHSDLLSALSEEAPELYKYYVSNCKASFVKRFYKKESIRTLGKVISDDWKTSYLYFMYYTEKAKNNNLTAYAYFKNFFDRVTADLDHVNKIFIGESERRPNYNGFFKEKALCDFYKDINGSAEIIKKAHKLRNENPVSHSSARIIENNSTTTDIYQTIKDLENIIHRYILQEEIDSKCVD